ncbi:MAG: hypothetical protein M1837_005311 [Sclerophora amabilis]|nr:MAG: hypothetical protein M1837_005311 [Sclerophora amabilis]
MSRRLSHHSEEKRPSREDYIPVFALYLDVQKQLLLDELPDDEGRGRWKSFVGRCPGETLLALGFIKGDSTLTFVRNRGELAEGWYDPSTIQKAMESESTNDAAREASSRRRDSPDYGAEMPATKPMGNQNQNNDGDDDDDEDDDDVVGPTLPGQESRSRRTGPAVPTLQDLELRREADHESESEARESLRQDRALDRKTQRERLDELVPRADAGTRERQLEKKRALTDKLRSYRDKSPVEEVRDAELLGADEDDDRGGGGTLEGFKKRKKEMERKKNDRELRREEVLRARAEEREERMRIHKAKEDKTLTMLKSLAKQNFG